MQHVPFFDNRLMITPFEWVLEVEVNVFVFGSTKYLLLEAIHFGY